MGSGKLSSSAILTMMEDRDSTTGKDYVLYQPEATKQILLYDLASSSSVLTFLKMHKIPVTLINHPNTEFMSDNGRLPVVVNQGGGKPMFGFKEVFWHVSRARDYQPSLLELAYIEWVETNFLEAEMYMCWCYESTLNNYTKNRYMHYLPWPVSSILLKQRRQHMQQNIGKRYANADMTAFLEKFGHFLKKLNKTIGSKQFFPNNSSPSAVNALIYGHVSAIRNTNLHPSFVELIRSSSVPHKNLENLVATLEQHYPL